MHLHKDTHVLFQTSPSQLWQDWDVCAVHDVRPAKLVADCYFITNSVLKLALCLLQCSCAAGPGEIEVQACLECAASRPACQEMATGASKTRCFLAGRTLAGAAGLDTSLRRLVPLLGLRFGAKPAKCGFIDHETTCKEVQMLACMRQKRFLNKGPLRYHALTDRLLLYVGTHRTIVGAMQLGKSRMSNNASTKSVDDAVCAWEATVT